MNEWIRNELAPAIGRLGLTSVYVICDKSRAHQKLAMLEASKAGRCREVVDVLFMPIASAKYISPLDNPLWHSFKETVRKQHPLQANDTSESLSDTFLLYQQKKFVTLIENAPLRQRAMFLEINLLCR